MGSRRDDEEQAAAVPLLAAAYPTPSGLRRSHAGDVHLLSAAFLFVFSAYLPTQNLQSTLNTVRTSRTCSGSTKAAMNLWVHDVFRFSIPCASAGGQPGRRVHGDPVRLLHRVHGDGGGRGAAAGVEGRARRRHQRLRALHPRQPPPNVVHDDAGFSLPGFYLIPHVGWPGT